MKKIQNIVRLVFNKCIYFIGKQLSIPSCSATGQRLNSKGFSVYHPDSYPQSDRPVTYEEMMHQQALSSHSDDYNSACNRQEETEIKQKQRNRKVWRDQERMRGKNVPNRLWKNQAEKPRFKVQILTPCPNGSHPLWNDQPASSHGMTTKTVHRFGKNAPYAGLSCGWWPAERKHSTPNNSFL